MNPELIKRVQGIVAGMRKRAADSGPMHSAWEDIFDIEELLKQLDWQPIETAPRDGTWVLLKGGMIDVESYALEGIDSLPPAVFARWYAPMETWCYAFWDGAWRGDYNNPTHWRYPP